MADLNSRLDALATALAAAVTASGSGRAVSRDFLPYDAHPDAALLVGVWAVVLRSEAEFADHRHPEAVLGTAQVGIIGQLKVPEGQSGGAVEALELAMVAELKTLHNHLPQELHGYRLLRHRTSGQLSAPYGFVAAEVELRP